MDQADLGPLIADLSTDVSALSTALAPLLNTPLSTISSKLPLLDKAKLHILSTYAIESLLFSSLRLSGVDAKQHPIFTELARVRQYFEKIKKAEEGPENREQVLDKGAAGRFIRHALGGNEKLDKERLEDAVRQKEGAKRKLSDLDRGADAGTSGNEHGTSDEHDSDGGIPIPASSKSKGPSELKSVDSRVCLGNLAPQTTPEDIKKILKEYGFHLKIHKVRLKSRNGQPVTQTTIPLSSPEEAQRAISTMTNVTIHGQRITVQPCVPKSTTEPVARSKRKRAETGPVQSSDGDASAQLPEPVRSANSESVSKRQKTTVSQTHDNSKNQENDNDGHSSADEDTPAIAPGPPTLKQSKDQTRFVHIGSLSRDTTAEDLQKAFRTCGLEIPKDNIDAKRASTRTGKLGRSTIIIALSSRAEAHHAVSNMTNVTIHGLKIVVRHCNPKSPRILALGSANAVPEPLSKKQMKRLREQGLKQQRPALPILSNETFWVAGVRSDKLSSSKTF